MEIEIYGRLFVSGVFISSNHMIEETIASNWASTEVRVRYAETDQMGVVYYANYLVWFEIGRASCRERVLYRV